MNPEISVIVPVLNESRFLESMVLSLLSKGNVSKEILLVDGDSTDNTREVIEQLVLRYPQVNYILNTERFVSPGFNKAFLSSKGKYIAFLGAHAIYPDTFFDLAVHHLTSENCDAVGGPLKQVGKSKKGEAVAYCMSQRIGVGDTEFRTVKEKKYVDSVAFAVYKREVFDRIGLLDTELIRNQDDEFHYRMNANGMKILMVPEMQSTYYVRDTFRGLFKQYYQYGLYKPLVLQKVKSGMRIRHLVPAAFVLYLITLPLSQLVSRWAILPLVFYACVIGFFSFQYRKPLVEKAYAFLSFFLLHFSYGLGFLRGLFKLKR